MRKIFTLFAVILLSLAACGTNADNDEIHMLEVEFDVPEQIDVGEPLVLEAVVSYGDEPVKDADEVTFEVWEKNDQDNAVFYDAENNEDGTYTYELTFDHDGIFEMYAHTTARDQHTMPLREITVGEGGEYEDEEGTTFDTEGFDMHFMDVEDATIDEEVELIVHVMLDESHLADANVRYEIWHEEDEENRDWIDTTEDAEQYSANYTFEESGLYHIQVHVEDDDDLHEHAIYTVNVE